MTKPWLLFLLLHAVSPRKLTEEENEKLKQRCNPVMSSAVPRVKRRQPVNPSEYPFATELFRLDGNTKVDGTSKYISCSGVLISPRHILTAAHCLYANKSILCFPELGPFEPVNNVIVYIYSNCNNEKCWIDKKRNETASVTLHPNAIPCQRNTSYPILSSYASNDLGIIELNEDVNSAPICMPNANSVISDPSDFESVGYGGKVMGRLQSVRFQYIKEDGEKALFAANYSSKYDENGLVKGDSGGPLFQEIQGKHYLFGIFSLGGWLLDLGRYSVGGMFADVRKHLQWICDETGVCPLTEKANNWQP